MSAICGAVGLDGRPFTDADLTGMLDVLGPLGPHGGGAWFGTAGRLGVAVASRLRRRTHEDSADQQPVVSRDGSVVVVADVRLDNRRELAWALDLRNAIDVPDSAFVLAAYERWGTGLPERLDGVFAIAIVDQRRGGVLLARDHAGARPLVVHERRGVVAFASNALALTGFDGVGHRLDVERAKETLALVFDSDRTFVDGVHWVPEGGRVWIDETGTRHDFWWNPDASEIVDLGSPTAHAEALRAALDEAVAAQLRTVGDVGAQVSGGLDSTSIAATAALQLSPAPLRTYTSAPPRDFTGSAGTRTVDESPLVRDLAAMHPTMQPAFIDVRGAPLFEDRYESRWAMGAGPPLNACNALWIDAIDRRASSDGVGALLTGSQGNRVLSADGDYWLAALARTGQWRMLARELRAEGFDATTVRHHLVRPLVPGVVRWAWARAGAGSDPLATWLASIPLRREVASSLGLERRIPFLDPRSRPDQRRDLMRSVAPFVADSEAARGALHGLDVRDPAVDRRVLVTGMAQPDWVRRHDGVTRAVVREAMADRLPASIASRVTRGAQLPDWLDRLTDARAEIAAEIDAVRAHDLSRSLLDVERLERLLASWPDPTTAGNGAIQRDYRLVLLRALAVSRYLRWFDGRATSRSPTMPADLPIARA